MFRMYQIFLTVDSSKSDIQNEKDLKEFIYQAINKACQDLEENSIQSH